MASWKMAEIGLESRDRALLETAIDLASGLEIGRWEFVDDHAAAQVIIANIDMPEGKNALKAYESGQTDMLIVPFSPSSNAESTADIKLSPPLSYKNVTSLLNILEIKLGTPTKTEPTPTDVTCLNAKAVLIPEVEINPVDVAKHKIDWLSDDADENVTPLLSEVVATDDHVTHANIEKIDNTNESSLIVLANESFNSGSRLLGLLLNIIEKGKTTQISHNDYPDLRIFPDNGWFVFSEELDSYPKMFRESAKSFIVEILDEEIKDELFSGHLPQSLWKLLFTAALFGSEGKLLEHLNSGASFHLIHTPYFGMIPHTSDHITIAEFMVDNNSDIETISNSTNIDIETVIDFCNACDAIQLLKTGEIIKPETNSELTSITALENDTTIESEIIRDTDKPKKTGLINTLWSNLTKSS